MDDKKQHVQTENLDDLCITEGERALEMLPEAHIHQKMLVPSHETVFSQCLTSKICQISITVGTAAHGSHGSMKASSYIWLVNRFAVFYYVSGNLHKKKII